MSLPHALVRAAGQLADPAILRVLVKSVLATLTIVALLIAGLWAILDTTIEGWIADLTDEDYSDSVASIVTAIIGFIAGWLLLRIVALAVIQFFADEIVLAVERRHYPDAADSARDLSFSESLGEGAKGAGRALLVNLLIAPIAIVLLITGFGTFLLFWIVNAWLLGRELQDIAWLRHRGGETDKQTAPLPLSGLTRFLLGGAIAAMLAVPFLNLLAPVIGAAAATHLVQNRSQRNPDAA